MKKFAMVLALLAFSAVPAMAGVDVGVWWDCPESISKASVDGVRFGLPLAISEGKVSGAELALCASATDYVHGVKFTLIGVNYSKLLRGASLAFVNWSEQLRGLQWGFLNNSGKGGFQVGFVNNCENNATFQLGLININANGWLPVMIFVNFGNDVF